MTPIYVLLFRADTGRFVKAVLARSNEHAAGFAEGVQMATKRRHVYVWPKDRQRANQEESFEQMARANRAIKKDMARREQEVATPKSTIDVPCDECPAKAGEWCQRNIDGKWTRRYDGFHSSRVAKARGR